MNPYRERLCDYCSGSIQTGQRWVRQKVYKPLVAGTDPTYRHYHAEAFVGQGASCWEKHQTQQLTHPGALRIGCFDWLKE